MRRLISGFLVILMAISCFAFSCGVAAASETDGKYRVRTDDGADLYLVRYRPDENSSFHAGKQPVLIMPAAAVNLKRREGSSLGMWG